MVVIVCYNPIDDKISGYPMNINIDKSVTTTDTMVKDPDELYSKLQEMSTTKSGKTVQLKVRKIEEHRITSRCGLEK